MLLLKLHVIIKAMLREIVLDIDELIIDELGNDSYNKGIYFKTFIKFLHCIITKISFLPHSMTKVFQDYFFLQLNFN